MDATVDRSRSLHNYLHMQTWPFWGVHVAAVLGVCWVGFSWSGLALAVGLYCARMFFVAAA